MPAPAIVVTPGANNANSFATVAEYKTYWGGHLFNTAALAATDDQIAAALIMAGRGLNDLLVWNGVIAASTQSMMWPRIGLLTRAGAAIDGSTIPDDLKASQCEWAGQYVSANLFATNSSLQKGIKSLTAGPTSITYQDASSFELQVLQGLKQSPEFAYLSSMVPSMALMLLNPDWYQRKELGREIDFSGHR